MPKDLTFNEDVRKKILSGMEELNKAIGQLPQKAKCTIQTMTINKDEDDSNKSWDCISMAERLKSKLPKV